MKAVKILALVGLIAASAIALPDPSSSDNHEQPPEATAAATVAQPVETVAAREIVIGGGGVSGAYFPVAGAICQVVTARNPDWRCLVESNANSSKNLERLNAGLLDFAIVQSDWLMHAANGTNLFRPSGPDESLRAVFSLHAEALTLVARGGAKIESPSDLEDKRVNLGPGFTYQRILTEAMLRAYGLDADDLALAQEAPAVDQFAALCAGDLDAAAIVTAHPSPLLADALQRCDLKLIPVAGEAIDELLEGRRDLAAATIPGGLYAKAPEATPTFGLRAVLATTTNVDDAVVRTVADSVLTSMPEFTVQHPVLNDLMADRMALDGIGLKLHPSAESIFRVRSLLPQD